MQFKTLLGFGEQGEKPLNAMGLARAVKTLETEQNYNGKVMTRKDYIVDCILNGGEAESYITKNKNDKEVKKSRIFRNSRKETFVDITKTELDFARHIKGLYDQGYRYVQFLELDATQEEQVVVAEERKQEQAAADKLKGQKAEEERLWKQEENIQKAVGNGIRHMPIDFLESSRVFMQEMKLYIGQVKQTNLDDQDVYNTLMTVVMKDIAFTFGDSNKLDVNLAMAIKSVENEIEKVGMQNIDNMSNLSTKRLNDLFLSKLTGYSASGVIRDFMLVRWLINLNIRTTDKRNTQYKQLVERASKKEGSYFATVEKGLFNEDNLESDEELRSYYQDGTDKEIVIVRDKRTPQGYDLFTEDSLNEVPSTKFSIGTMYQMKMAYSSIRTYQHVDQLTTRSGLITNMMMFEFFGVI